MKSSSEWITHNHVNIHVKKWIGESLPRAIVQISHGMAEHIERYDHFAQYLVEKGIYVYGNDHRGHGLTGEKSGQHGFFSEENGDEIVVDDLYEVTKFIKEDYPDVPIFLMGHSMGSFLARRYIQKYPHFIKGIIISGTGGDPGLVGKIGKFLTKREMKKHGKSTSSNKLDSLFFGTYNKGIQNKRTKFDWLTRNQDEVDKYIEDPYCGFVCSTGFFYDLLTVLEKIHDNQQIQRVPKDLPIFIFSGELDPVGGKTKGVNKVIRQYKLNGITNIEYKYYQEGRHEMLNEWNKEEVYHDIYQWIDHQLNFVTK